MFVPLAWLRVLINNRQREQSAFDVAIMPDINRGRASFSAPHTNDQKGGHHEKANFRRRSDTRPLALAVASVHAQSRTKIEATIPFDFTAGETALNAGVYSLRFVSHNALLLRSADGKESAIIVAPRAVGPNHQEVRKNSFLRLR
jgi:hypothetical protein